jgi:hypothetical protein
MALDCYQIIRPRAYPLGLAEHEARKRWWEEFGDKLSEDNKITYRLETEWPNVTLQILPLDAQHSILRKDSDTRLHDVVSSERLRSGLTLEGKGRRTCPDRVPCLLSRSR